MTSNSTDSRCASGDNLCVVRVYEQEVIIVPVLLLLSSAATMLAVCLLRGCPPRRGPLPHPDPAPRHSGNAPPTLTGRTSRRPDRGRDLRGIDAPEEFNVMEYEVVHMPLHPVHQAPPLHHQAPPLHHQAPPLHPSDHIYTVM